jgi:hypothetical protein
MNSFLLLTCLISISLFGLLESVGNKGVAWSSISAARRDYNLDLEFVACEYCDSYGGETPCQTKLPILCYSTCNFKRPPYKPIGKEFSDGWSGGFFRLTAPIAGTNLLSSSNMDSICQQQFGSSFAAAHHHMGRYVNGMSDTSYFYNTWPENPSSGGWGARGYGILNTTSNFWVYVRDQPSNCWNQ